MHPTLPLPTVEGNLKAVAPHLSPSHQEGNLQAVAPHPSPPLRGEGDKKLHLVLSYTGPLLTVRVKKKLYSAIILSSQVRASVTF